MSREDMRGFLLKFSLLIASAIFVNQNSYSQVPIGCNDLGSATVGQLPSGWSYTTYEWNPNNFSQYSSTPARVFVLQADRPDMLTQSVMTYLNVSSNPQWCAAVGSNCLCVEYAPSGYSYCQNVYIYPPVMHLVPATYTYSVVYATEADMSFNYYISDETVAGSVCDLYFGTVADYTQMIEMSDIFWQYTRSGWEGNIYTFPVAACNSIVRIKGTFTVTTEGDYYVGMKAHANTSSINTYPARMTIDDFCLETEDPICSASIEQTSGQCEGKINVEASGNGTAPYTYAWSDGGAATAEREGLTAGTEYTVTVTDADNCTATASITPVRQNHSLTYTAIDEVVGASISVSPTYTCNGETASFSSTDIPSWLTLNPSTGKITGTAPSSTYSGSFHVTLTCGECTDVATISVTISSNCEISIESITSTDPSCNGAGDGTATVSVTGGNGTYTYIWNDGVETTNATRTGLDAGTYSVTVRDSDGCESGAGGETTADCFRITDLMFHSCGSQEGFNEMVTIKVGPSALNVDDMTVVWATPANQTPFTGFCTNPSIVAAINNTITGDGQLIEPTNGVLPANAEVLIITSTRFDYQTFDFSALDHDVYVIFQCNTTVTTGHFGNSTGSTRSFSISFGTGCSEQVSYKPVTNNAGDAVHYNVDGTKDYYNSGCEAPIFHNSVELEDPDAINLSYLSISGVIGVAITSLSPTTDCNGTASYSSTDLPAGLSVNSTTGVISGTPSSVGSGTAHVTITCDGCETTANVTYSVRQPDATTCYETGTLLFKEDFGGNDVTDNRCASLADLAAMGMNTRTNYATAWEITECNVDRNYQYTPSVNGWDCCNHGPCIDDRGVYAIVKFTHPNHTGWAANLSDHTFPDDVTRGYMMQVDAGSTSGMFYQTTINGLCSGAVLYFSTWILNVNTSQGISGLNFHISNAANNAEIADYTTPAISASSNPTWTRYGMTFVVPAGVSSVKLSLNNPNASTSGNDFAIDDIEIRLCVPEITLPSGSDETAKCEGDTYSIDASFTNDGTFSAPLQYQWFYSTTGDPLDNSDWTAVTGQTAEDLSLTNVQEANEGYYRLVVASQGGINTNCRSVSDPIHLTVNPTPTASVSISGDDEVCVGEDAVLAAGPTTGVTYRWSTNPAQTTQTINIHPTAQTTYTVTVTKGSCTNAASITVGTCDCEVTASATQTAGYCNGTITLQAAGANGSGNYSYRWNTGATTAQLTNATNNQQYSVTVTDTDTHCTASTTITATQTGNPVIATPTVPAITCNGGTTSITLSVSGGYGTYTYAWPNSTNTTNVLSNVAAGTYNVTVTDGHSCQTTLSVPVSQPNAITMTTSTVNQICAVLGSAFVTSTTGGANTTYTYVWTNSANQQVGTGTSITEQLMAGTYEVVATDVNGCTGSTTAVVQGSGSSVSFDESTVNLTCHGDNTGEINLTNITGRQPFTVTWRSESVNETIDGLNADSYSITGLPAEEYTVVVVDADRCSYTEENILLLEPAALEASASITSDINCHGDKFDITASATGGTGTNYSYHWSNNVDQQSQFGLENYITYSVTITDENLCEDYASVMPQNERPDLLQIHVTYDPIACNGGSTTITVSGEGGTGEYSGTGVFANQVADTYNYTITDENGCAASSGNIEVSQPAQISISIGTIVPQTCETLGRVPFTLTGGTGALSYSWDGGDATTYASAVNSSLSTGNHTLSVSDASGCSASKTINVPNASAMSVALESQTNVSCNGASTGAFTIRMTNGTSPYVITWTNGTLDESLDSHTFENLSANTYNVTVSDANGCSDNISVSLSQSESVMVTALLASPILCHNDAFGIVASAEGGNGGFTYHWSNNVDGASQSNLTNYTTYNVTATDVEGCFGTASVTPSNPTAITLLGIDAGAIRCSGETTTVIAYAQGGTGDLTYTWSTAGVTGVNSQQITAPAGSYNLVVTDENGCSVTIPQPLQIAGPDPISITLNSVTAQHCSTNGQVNLTVSGGTGILSYTWNGTSTQSVVGTSIVSQLAAGNYILTVTDANNCSATQTVSVDNSAPMSITADNLQHIGCAGDSDGSFDIMMTNGSAPYTITWNNGIFTEQNASHTFANLVAGTYYVTVEDAYHCSGNVTVEITEPRQLEAISTAGQIACHDGTANVTINGLYGTVPYHVEYNGSTIDVGTYNLPAGEYDYVVVDNNGCRATTHVSLANPEALAVVVTTSDALCNGGNGSAELQVSGGTRPYSVIWQDGTTDMVNTHVPSNVDYAYTVTDINGCTNVDAVNVGQPAALALTLTSTDVSCYRLSDGSVSVQSITGGVMPYGYSWSNGQVGTSTISGLRVGNYTLVVTDDNNCTVSATANVMQPEQLSASIVASNVECGVSEGSVTANVHGGTGDYSYLWTNGRVDATVGNLTSGTYSLTATDANGCTATASARITIAGMLTASINEINPISCFGMNDATIAAEVEMAQPPVTYVWNSGQNGQTQYGLGFGQYTVTITDGWGCVGIASYLVSSPSAIMLTAQTTDALCYNTYEGSILTHVSGGHPPYSYLWTNGSTDSNLVDLRQGTYGLVVTDSTGCMLQQTFAINAPERMEITPEITNIDCYGKKNGKLQINVQGGVEPYDYGFSIGNAMVHGTNYYEHLKPGSYEIMIGDANGCRESKTVIISEPAKMEGEAVVTMPSCKDLNDGMVEMHVLGGSEPYVYTLNSYTQDSSLFTGLRAGKYNITVVDANGCSFELEEVSVPRSNADCIRIPNVFTPNSDGINDEWIIENIETFPEAHIYVFNRWGQLMYHGRGADEPWNGEFKGHFVPAGVYLYVIDLHTVKETYEGTVTVLF